MVLIGYPVEVRSPERRKATCAVFVLRTTSNVFGGRLRQTEKSGLSVILPPAVVTFDTAMVEGMSGHFQFRLTDAIEPKWKDGVQFGIFAIGAFGRDQDVEDAYFVSVGEAKERMEAAKSWGLTDLHVVGGLTRKLNLDYYKELLCTASQINLQSGLSVFDYWNNIEETRDYSDAVCDVSAAARALAGATGALDIPFSVVGYSFGTATGLLYGYGRDHVWNMVAIAPPLGKVSFEFMSDCSKPCLCLIGKGDFLYSEEKTEELRRILPSNAIVEILETADHFFRGDEYLMTQKVDEFVRNNVIVSSEETSDAI